ncbi:MAG: MetQ/NlpA family ABC transporter substrate-binding protein [Candidatus Izemoplasmataceae bacterium]
MKKLFILTITSLLLITLSACGGSDTYTVGASPTPHADILREARELMDDEYDFEIQEFNDYVMPNTALDEGEIDANYFQHLPYLEAQIDEYGYDFENVGGVHIEPIGLYSREYDSLDDLPDEVEIIISNSPSDRPRLLTVLEDVGLITLDEDTTEEAITDQNVDDLPELFDSEKTITFEEVSAEQLYSNYDNESGDLVLINGNFALDNGLNPQEDAIALESGDSPYVNVLVAREENADDDFVQALYEALTSDEIKAWIEDEYEGSVVIAD